MADILIPSLQLRRLRLVELMHLIEGPTGSKWPVFKYRYSDSTLEKKMATHSSILAWKNGQRSLVGSSSQCLKESDMTEHTHRPRTPSPLPVSLYALLPHATCLFCLFVCLFWVIGDPD